MKRLQLFSFSFILILLFFSNISCNKHDNQSYSYSLRFVSEEYKPLNYTEGDASPVWHLSCCAIFVIS